MSRIQAGHLQLNPQTMSLTELVHPAGGIGNGGDERAPVRGAEQRACRVQRAGRHLGPGPYRADPQQPAAQRGEIQSSRRRDTGHPRRTAARSQSRQQGARTEAARQLPPRMSPSPTRGIGIPPGGLQHIFERFYRAPNTSDIQGTGLGLYICQQLAAAHHGMLWAESRGLGHGSTFHLVLPL